MIYDFDVYLGDDFGAQRKVATSDVDYCDFAEEAEDS